MEEVAMDDVDRLADGLADVLSIGDASTLEAVFSDDYVEEYPQSGERIEGRERVRAMLDAFPDGTRPIVTGDRRITRTGDGFVGEYTLDYGPGGIYRVVGFYTVRDGRVVASREYFAAPFEPAEWRKPFATARS
jgi:ketosteroid isomerase-like protein